MLQKRIIEYLNNNNHYTVDKCVLRCAKDANLDSLSLILLIYVLNQKNKELLNCNKIMDDLAFNDKELYDSLSKLKDNKFLTIVMEKNEAGILEEKIDVDSFYEIMFAKLLDEEKKDIDHNDLYSTFEKEFGRTLSPMEYEIINNWTEQNISNELILAALKETVFNGVNNLRYVDKILFEWGRKGIKKASDIVKKEKEEEDNKPDTCFEYDWLNE